MCRSLCLAWSLGVVSRLRGRSRSGLGLPGLGQTVPGLGARHGGVHHAVGCVGQGPGREGVQAEDGGAPGVDGQHDDQHAQDVEQESCPDLVCRESV